MRSRLLAIVLPIVLAHAPAWAAEPATPTVVAAPATPAWPHRKGWPAFGVGLGTTVGFGVAQRVAVGSTLNFIGWWSVTDLPIDGVSVLYSIRWDPPAAGYVPGLGKDHPLKTERMLLLIDPCIHRWHLFACAVFGGGRLGIDWKGWTQGGSYGYDPAIAVTGGRLGADVPLTSNFGIRVSAELLGTITPITIPVNDRDTWTTPRVSGGIEVGLYISQDPR